MWTNYSIRYIKNNKSNSIFLAVISFAATTFLAFICSMAYNMWMDHIDQIIAGEGSYTARPEPLAAAYGFVMAAASLSLIFMIHNAFEVPMNSRIHQLGILQSVGATPRQIRSFLLQEVMVLCAVPVVLGTGAGIGLSFILFQAAIGMTGDVRTYQAAFHFHVLIVLLSLLAAGLTIYISAWIPAKRLSKLTPLSALGYGVETDVRRMKKFSFFSKIFGINGELARKSLYARRRELRTSTLSLALAFIALTGLLNIEAISSISTKHTYFQRFQDKWDLLLTTDASVNILTQIKEIQGIKNCIVYQKAEADTLISEASFSDELKQIGIQNLNESYAPDSNQRYSFPVPVYILDDESFASYCSDNEVAESGVVAINTIWDSLNSSRKSRTYLPLVDESQPLTVKIAGNTLTIGSFATEMPGIKEEYEQYSLSLVMSERYYGELAAALPVEKKVYNIFLNSSEEAVTNENKESNNAGNEDEPVQTQIRNILGGAHTYMLESRAKEAASELRIRSGLRFFICCFAGFLAGIGIINIFSFTLGQIFQRKKEFARYFSIGMTPRGMGQILTIEAAVICLRPLALSLLVNIPLVAFTLDAAEISFSEYMMYAPILPIVLFTLTVYIFILLAYYLGGRTVCRGDFVEIIKDEALL